MVVNEKCPMAWKWKKINGCSIKLVTIKEAEKQDLELNTRIEKVKRPYYAMNRGFISTINQNRWWNPSPFTLRQRYSNDCDSHAKLSQNK